VRVLIVTTWFPSRQSPGAAVFCLRHAEAIARHHEVQVLHLAPAGTTPVALPGGSVTVVPASFARPVSVISALRAVRRLGRAWSPDIVHTMGFSSLVYGAALRGAAPWVHTEHWSGAAEPASVGPLWQAASAARHLLRLPTVVTAVSTYLAESLKPFARDVRVVPNVVDGPAAPPPLPHRETLDVLTVGALRPVKDPVLAVRTVDELRRRGHDVRMRVAGSGELEPELRKLIADLGLEDRVRLLGQVPSDELEDHFAWCSVFLLTSHLETFCVAGAEALVHGRPVVLGAVGGQGDFVGPRSGELVGPRTPEAFADAVERVQERFRTVDPEELAGPVRERFSGRRVAEAFDRVYSGVNRR
jgi:glycosyltransferase involved in cell wall biosynthesis